MELWQKHFKKKKTNCVIDNSYQSVLKLSAEVGGNIQ